MEIHITMLPSEILLKIFSFFDARNLLDAEKVCHQWEQLSNTPFLWKTLCTKKQKGATELMNYRISIEEENKKRKRDESWKQMYFHYLSFSWFLDGKCTTDLLKELEVATYQMLDLVNSNFSSNPSELVWLHSVVFNCCVKASHQSSLQPILDVYKNAVVKEEEKIFEDLQEVKDDQTWLEKVVQSWKSHSKFVDLLFTFFRPMDKKQELFGDGETLNSFAKNTFFNQIFKYFREQILKVAESLAKSQDQTVNVILRELYKMFSYFDEPFLGSDIWLPPQEEPIQEKQIMKRRWKFSSSDEVVFVGNELALMSPVLRDIMNKM